LTYTVMHESTKLKYKKIKFNSQQTVVLSYSVQASTR